MNGLDLLIVVAAVGAAVGGMRLGFVTRVVSWVTMLVGLLAAALVVPAVIGWFEDQPAVSVAAACIVLLAGALIGQVGGLIVGMRLRPRPTDNQRWHQVDVVAGALAGIGGVLAGLWIITPALIQAGGSFQRQAEDSAIASVLDDALPARPAALENLASRISDEFPVVFLDGGPEPNVGAPPVASGISDALHARVLQAIVQVRATPCARIQEGSGFAIDAGPGLVITNAHVVAGASQVTLFTNDEREGTGTVVGFDPQRDLAVIRTTDLDLVGLPVGSSDVGDIGGAYGFPGGGSLEVSPYRIDHWVNGVGEDIYGQGHVEREIYFLAAEIRTGDSGAALVDPDGSVAGVVFAVRTDKSNVGLALTPMELRAMLDEQDIAAESDPGPCLQGG